MISKQNLVIDKNDISIDGQFDMEAFFKYADKIYRNMFMMWKNQNPEAVRLPNLEKAKEDFLNDDKYIKIELFLDTYKFKNYWFETDRVVPPNGKDVIIEINAYPKDKSGFDQLQIVQVGSHAWNQLKPKKWRPL